MYDSPTKIRDTSDKNDASVFRYVLWEQPETAVTVRALYFSRLCPAEARGVLLGTWVVLFSPLQSACNTRVDKIFSSDGTLVPKVEMLSTVRPF